MNAMSNPMLIIMILAFFGCTKEESNGVSIKLNPIPDNAKIIFHENNLIYAMDQNGDDITQITFDDSRVLEHVAVSHNRTKIALNYFSNPSVGGASSKVLLLDLSQKTIEDILLDQDGSGYELIKNGVNIGKWIPN